MLLLLWNQHQYLTVLLYLNLYIVSYHLGDFLHVLLLYLIVKVGG